MASCDNVIECPMVCFAHHSPPASEGCPQLEQLNISWCDQVTKDGIQALVRSCPGLKGLFLKGCTQVGFLYTSRADDVDSSLAVNLELISVGIVPVVLLQ